MIYKEISYEVKPYMYTAKLDNGVTIHAFTDGTAIGSDGCRYRLCSYVDRCEVWDVLDEVVPQGWEKIE